MKRFRFVSILFILLLMLSGCSKQEDSFGYLLQEWFDTVILGEEDADTFDQMDLQEYSFESRESVDVLPESQDDSLLEEQEDSEVAEGEQDENMQEDLQSSDSEVIVETPIPQEESVETVQAGQESLLSVTEETGLSPTQLSVEKYYAYGVLTESYRALYGEIYDILRTRSSEVTVSTTDETVLDIVFQCVLCDHPELFYVDGYSYVLYYTGDTIDRLAFSGSYTMTQGQIDDYQVLIDRYVTDCLALIPKDADEYTKSKFVYEYIILNTGYDLNAIENQNIVSVFVYGSSVCQGYAKAYQYILQKMNMVSALTTGVVHSGEGHAWNLVKIDGAYYYVDATWGDASYLMGEDAGIWNSNVDYNYLNITTQELSATHQITSAVIMPDCVSNGANYYIREGLFFSSADIAALKTIVANAQGAGKTFISIKCSSQEVYSVMYQELITKARLSEVFPNATSVAYTTNESLRTYGFWL